MKKVHRPRQVAERRRPYSTIGTRRWLHEKSRSAGVSGQGMRVGVITPAGGVGVQRLMVRRTHLLLAIVGECDEVRFGGVT